MPEAWNPLQSAARIETGELVQAAAKIVGFKMGKREYGGARNVSGVRTSTLTFSRRLDSRTIFASDNRYGYLGKVGVWTGPDKKAASRCRAIMRAAGVPTAEIAGVAISSEMGAVAQRSSDGEFKQGEPHLLRKLVQATRAIDGVPIWASYVRLGLTAKGDVGLLELHWPDLSPAVIKEATLLKTMVKRGFKAPPLAGARLETLSAGITHSPAIGFFMDQMAAVRAIYIADDPTIGRKPTLYLDRHGEPVVMPREIALAQQEGRDARSPLKEASSTTS
jgi:hypothetical protein